MALPTYSPALAKVPYPQDSQAIVLDSSETLSTIADRAFGDVTRWRELYEANGADIFGDLPIGKEIKIPTYAELEAIAVSMSANAINDLKGTVTSNKLYQDVDRITGGILTKFVDKQFAEAGETVKAAIGKLGGLSIGAKGVTPTGAFKLIDWLY
jgi:hypothetical protein